MAYTTTIKVARKSGVGLRIVNENVGTGDNSETDFDLDKNNIIASSYTLYHAASGSNSFTALTETTHYTLDKESGRIELTAGGVTEVGTDIIYADYTYTDEFSDEVLSDFITQADAITDQETGRKWNVLTSAVEYQNGRATLRYPTTDNPYAGDFDDPDFIMLDNHPINKITNVYFLANEAAIGKFFNYDDDVTTFTDYTDNVNNSEEADFTAFASTPAANDIIYIGMTDKFLGLFMNLTTLGTGSPAITWQYYNGSTWASLTVTETHTDSSTLKASGRFTWQEPANWAKTTVNSSDSLYFVRGLLTVGYTVAPVIDLVNAEDVLSQKVHNRDIRHEDYGKLYFTNVDVPHGTRNVRIDYTYGTSSVPALVEELSTINAALQISHAILGGSYDTPTSFSLGSKSATVGEPSLNLRINIEKFTARKQQILKLLAVRGDVFAA